MHRKNSFCGKPGGKSGKRKFVVITGGVISGIGKGIFTASLGKLLQSRGLCVAPMKIDPYINVDAGTMNPVEHGEVFVLDDGSEVDMDLGNYERFLSLNLTSKSNVTTGKIYKKVIDRERNGDYLGKTVQLIPHITDELKAWFRQVADERKADIELIEVGGTVGDIENLIFLEALRQLSMEEDVVFIHCTLVPMLKVVGEQKTKPTQQSVQKLREIGIQPDFIFLRCEMPIEQKIAQKIALFTGVCEENIIRGHDLPNIYELPVLLESQGVHEKLLGMLCMSTAKKDMKEWKAMVSRMAAPKKEITVAMTGKYTALHDSYVSIEQAIKHACGALGCSAKIKWVETTDIEKGKMKASEALRGADGIIVPGGFGSRGVEGKIDCIRVAREKGMPFLGLCLGFQLASIEFARNRCGLAGANSTEMDEHPKHPVIELLPSQRNVYKKGGTMRLGGQDVLLKKGTMAQKAYGGALKVRERFRHRYELNPDYIKRLEEKGLVFSGHDASGEIMQVLELPGHPFFMASQFHPEFTSRVLAPNPLFLNFVNACLKQKK